MTKFFGNEDMAKMIMAQNWKDTKLPKLKKPELTAEQIEELRKKRVTSNEATQKEKDLQYLRAYRAFYETPDATFETLKAAYKGHKNIKIEER
jgi:hypothetical protein